MDAAQVREWLEAVRLVVPEGDRAEIRRQFAVVGEAVTRLEGAAKNNLKFAGTQELFAELSSRFDGGALFVGAHHPKNDGNSIISRFWRGTRIAAVGLARFAEVQFLAEQGTPFRGEDREDVYSI